MKHNLDSAVNLSGATSGNPLPWESALDSLQTGMCVIDANWHVLYANAAARRLGIVDERQVTSLSLRPLLSQARRSGRVRASELDVEAPGLGEPTAVSVRITPMPDGLLVVELQDISETQRLERVRRDFVANVSHELKTPVGALQVLSEALSDAVTDPDATERFAHRVQAEASRMSALVADLLELSRIQGAERTPEATAVSIDAVVAEALDHTRIPAESKGIHFSVEGQKGLEVLGSEVQLITAVKNLVSNAVAYSPDNTVVRLTVDSCRPSDSVTTNRTVCICVADEGIGIAPKELDRIFERFYRADRARSRSTGGTGLGLAIVKHIAVNHGGKVDVTSTPEEGSVFTLMLPERSTDVKQRLVRIGEIWI
ncbi:ATP-binding protein [Haloglycomyces albus]|uniref:ATP-binding protein n=1 Tax=Haloglycomyces albus TaxID=526067 RepID=UPI00046C9E68|nr:ATP-binding protein [Haloglycomyces albus]